MNLEFGAVDQDSWADFEKLFESRGSPHYCWCTAWRVVEKQGKSPTKAEKKASMRSRILGGTPVGILAYLDGEPVAWCSIAPRETYRPLGGDESREGVWSLACFFIQRPFRGQGLSHHLIRDAVRYARENGARSVEAYPVDPGTSSYRFMGYRGSFEKAGFRFIKKAGKRRNVMLLELGEEG